MTQYGPAELPTLLRAGEGPGTTTAHALDVFDSLPGVTLDACIGRWQGSSLPTGHPLDGVLESLGWWGKEFVDPETVHPLLFRAYAGDVVALDPVPLLVRWLLRRPWLMRSRASRAAFAAVRPLLRTTEPKARLRRVEYRGVISVCMIYDALPILDVFRAVDPDTLLGLMDRRGMPRPFFFMLRRVPARH
jgi:hypothetical protein